MDNGRKQARLIALKKARGHVMWARVILDAVIDETAEKTDEMLAAERALREAAAAMKDMMDAMRS